MIRWRCGQRNARATWVQGLLVAQPIHREKGSFPEPRKMSPFLTRAEMALRGSGFSVRKTSSSIAIMSSKAKLPAANVALEQLVPLATRPCVGDPFALGNAALIGPPGQTACQGGSCSASFYGKRNAQTEDQIRRQEALQDHP